MFINESTNIEESAIFFEFMREALIEQVGDNEEMVSFIESASDTDVISYAVTGKAAPADLDSALYETALMSIIKENVILSPELFTESGDYTAMDFVNEIGTLSMITSKDILQEAIKGVRTDKLAKSNIDDANLSGTRRNLKNWVDNKVHATNQGAGEFDGTKSQMDKVAAEQKANNTAKQYGAGEFDGTKSQMDKIAGSGSFMNWFNKVKNNVTDSAAWGKITEFTSKHGTKIGVAALVAAASFIAYKAYKNYFSKAAKACAGKSGAEKAACMAKAKQSATRARLTALKKGASMAKNSTAPQKARAAIQAKIASMRG